ncbi:radical SAM protein [Candidatus Peregrinibacteria bacterium]|nr:radical SAM protein [Candidatus Peregrinibacteria bacterium]
MKKIYGPVPSWRLGRSLGIDPLSTTEKICSFDCIYCQLGKTKQKRIKRKFCVDEKQIGKELIAVLNKKVSIDIITFSGTGEPTLASNLDRIIKTIKNITDLPIAILTNSTLLNNQGVKSALMKVDKVVAKLDAWDDKSLKKINNPYNTLKFADLYKGIMNFRKDYPGSFCLQMMFMKEIESDCDKLAKLAYKLSPDEVQINTPLRPCTVSPLSKKELDKIKGHFKGMNVYTVYEKDKPQVKIFDLSTTLIRRPQI